MNESEPQFNPEKSPEDGLQKIVDEQKERIALDPLMKELDSIDTHDRESIEAVVSWAKDGIEFCLDGEDPSMQPDAVENRKISTEVIQLSDDPEIAIVITQEFTPKEGGATQPHTKVDLYAPDVVGYNLSQEVSDAIQHNVRKFIEKRKENKETFEFKSHISV